MLEGISGEMRDVESFFFSENGGKSKGYSTRMRSSSSSQREKPRSISESATATGKSVQSARRLLSDQLLFLLRSSFRKGEGGREAGREGENTGSVCVRVEGGGLAAIQAPVSPSVLEHEANQ